MRSPSAGHSWRMCVCTIAAAAQACRNCRHASGTRIFTFWRYCHMRPRHTTCFLTSSLTLFYAPLIAFFILPLLPHLELAATRSEAEALRRRAEAADLALATMQVCSACDCCDVLHGCCRCVKGYSTTAYSVLYLTGQVFQANDVHMRICSGSAFGDVHRQIWSRGGCVSIAQPVSPHSVALLWDVLTALLLTCLSIQLSNHHHVWCHRGRTLRQLRRVRMRLWSTNVPCCACTMRCVLCCSSQLRPCHVAHVLLTSSVRPAGSVLVLHACFVACSKRKLL